MRLDRHGETGRWRLKLLGPGLDLGMLRLHRLYSIILLPTYLPLPHSAPCPGSKGGVVTAYTGNMNDIILGSSLTLAPTVQEAYNMSPNA